MEQRKTLFVLYQTTTFKDNKFIVARMIIFLLDRLENNVGKGENTFILFPQCFQKPVSSGSLKVGIVWGRIN